jgi:O-antigen/teichoic acid export membrane protein
MDRIYWNTGQFVLGAFVGTTAVAVFALAIQLEHIYMNFSTAISSLFLPKVTSMVTKNDNKKEISDLFIKTGRIQYIVMCLMLSGFIVFGRDFIILWAGPGYEEVYIITLMFFVALLIPLIQNLGITILQARNQMKFRSLLYIGIAVVSLVFQIVLSKEYGGIGCAISIAGALLLGQGLVMNIYYRKKQELDVLHFWKEILKMSIVPIILIFIANYLLPNFVLDSWIKLGAAIGIFVVVYIPLFWMFSMNRYEKDLFITPLKKIVKR